MERCCRRSSGTSRTCASASATRTTTSRGSPASSSRSSLSGAGGDELFAGYPWRYYRAVVNDDFDDYVEKYYGFWHRLVPNERQAARFFTRRTSGARSRDLRRSTSSAPCSPDARRPAESPEDYVNHSLYLEAKTFLHGLLVVEDKLSMAHCLETRVPFLDNDLVDFALRLAVRLKLRDLDESSRSTRTSPAEDGALLRARRATAS